MSALVEQSLVVINRLMSQNRHNDALPLLESCMCTIREQQQQQNLDDNNNNSNISSSNNSLLLSKYLSKVTLKYATCLVRLQRHEAALHTIETSCCSSNTNNNQDSSSSSNNNNNNINNNNNNNLFNSNSNFITAAVVAGVIDPQPPRFLTETGPEGLVKNDDEEDDDEDAENSAKSNRNISGGYLTRAAIEIALESSLALADWYRAKLYANALLFIDARSCTALLALGKLACSSASAPTDAAAFLVRALRADPFCASAFEMIVDNWLLPTAELEQIVLSLDFNNNNNSGIEGDSGGREGFGEEMSETEEGCCFVSSSEDGEMEASEVLLESSAFESIG